LHRYDSELVLFVDPDEEGLVVVVEDATGLGPVVLKATRFEIFVTTLKEEVISNKLLLFFFSHFGEGVVFALELALKSVKSCNNFLFDCKALLTVDRGSKREFGKITGNTNAGGVNHGVLIRREVGAVKLGVVHRTDVFVVWTMTVVSLDDAVHKWCKIVVALV
jgi:nitrate/nitrite transporter NarK